jgi:hypothetical protein
MNERDYLAKKDASQIEGLASEIMKFTDWDGAGMLGVLRGLLVQAADVLQQSYLG